MSSGWSVQSVPRPAGATGAALSGVSCPATRACAAIGSYDTAGNTTGLPVAERWNGSNWSITAAPRVPNGAAWIALNGLSCPSAQTCTAVGNYQRSGSFTLAELWNGTTWSIQRTLTPAFADAALDAVSCTSASSCLAASDILVERWNGTAWSYVAPLPMPSWADLLMVGGISCRSSRWCMAVGQARWEGEDPSQQHPSWAAAWRWNGRQWSLKTFPGLDHLTAVSCPSESACLAVGGGTAERWNGHGWLRQRVSGGAVLSSVSCTSPAACTAVGRTSTRTLAARWNGRGWSTQPTPGLGPARSGHLDNVSCASARSCLAVGGYTSASGRDLPLAEGWTP